MEKPQQFEERKENIHKRTLVTFCEDDEKCGLRWGAITMNYKGKGTTKYLCHYHWLKHRGIPLEEQDVQRGNRAKRRKK